MRLHYLVLFIRFVHSIKVSPNSNCFWVCVDDIGTSDVTDKTTTKPSTDQIVCEDYQLAGPNSTVKGQKWKECLTCESSSVNLDPTSGESDIYWFLYNMKFSFAWCVFGYPDNKVVTAANIACAKTCQGPENIAKGILVNTHALDYNGSSLAYQYCETQNGTFPRLADDCIHCLEKVPNSIVMMNYFKALKAACSQQLAPGGRVQLDFDLFPNVSTPSFTTSVSVLLRTTDPVSLPSSAVSTIITPPSTVSTIITPPSTLSTSITPPSTVSTIIISNFTAATTQAKANPDKTSRLALAVGLVAAVAVAILAILGLIYKWVLDNNASRQGWRGRRQRCLPYDGRETLELDNTPVLEADDGKPRLELPSKTY